MDIIHLFVGRLNSSLRVPPRKFPQRWARAHIEPGRVARQPGFESNEVCTSLCRLPDEIESLARLACLSR